MASRAPNLLKTLMVSHLGGFRGVSTIPPRLKSPTAAMDGPHQKPKHNIGEMAPIAIVAGFVMLAIAIAAHTAKQQLVHSPSVHITKKKRGTMPELVEPDDAAMSGGKFIGKSFLRKVAQIQEPDPEKVISLPAHTDVYKSPKSESLKSVGVDPKKA